VAPNPSRATAQPPEVVPTFLGHSLGEFTSVAFILDRGQATIGEGRLDRMKEAVAKTLGQFGEGRVFQVLFWESNGHVWSFPKETPAPASKANIEEFRKEVAGVVGYGQTKVDNAVKKAVQNKPDAIVLIAVKQYLDDDFVQKVKRARGDSGAKVFTFSLWQPWLKPQLEQLATETGGTYKDVSVNELRDAAGAGR
jgi:hypothetical protein